MSDPYIGREQTKAKHFVLRHYLQALAFKVLTFSDIAYVDGFSGPWETKTENFSDSSFMIAISVLQDAQRRINEQQGVKRRIRCFLCETDPDAFSQLQVAVAPFNNPSEGFEIKTHLGKFEDAIQNIEAFVAGSFPLIFVDPKGWTGYPLQKIKPLFARSRCELLVNFMYEFINRFSHSEDPDIIDSLAPILGGTDWPERLDPTLSRGLAVEKLFKDTLKKVGGFDFVVSTKIDKATAERPHFFIVYATKNPAGLITFRETEYRALRGHMKTRAEAKERRREERSKTVDLFADHHAHVEESSIDEIVHNQCCGAREELLQLVATKVVPFSGAVAALLQGYMLRETNIKDICVDLAKDGLIENTWKQSGRKKPQGDDPIRTTAH